jgi:hypothetical protein
MSDLDAALERTGGFTGLTEAANAGDVRRKCLHPRQAREHLLIDGVRTWRCSRCSHTPDLVKQRRGRSAAKRGKAHERVGLRAMGIQHVGGLNRERDGGDRLDPFVVQWKSYAAGRFPNWMLDEIEKLRRVGLMPSQTPILVVTESRQGVKRRGLVVVELTDWMALHGPSGVAPVDYSVVNEDEQDEAP